MKKFKELLGGIKGIQTSNLMDDGSVNLQTISRYDENNAISFLNNILNKDFFNFKKLKDFWNTLKNRDALKRELDGADKRILYNTVVKVLESAQPATQPAANDADSEDPTATLLPTTREAESDTSAQPAAATLLPSAKGGGSSKRRRHHRRRTNKIRKSRNGRKIRRN
jgi:hypothetical protein